MLPLHSRMRDTACSSYVPKQLAFFHLANGAAASHRARLICHLLGSARRAIHCVGRAGRQWAFFTSSGNCSLRAKRAGSDFTVRTCSYQVLLATNYLARPLGSCATNERRRGIVCILPRMFKYLRGHWKNKDVRHIESANASPHAVCNLYCLPIEVRVHFIFCPC